MRLSLTDFFLDMKVIKLLCFFSNINPRVNLTFITHVTSIREIYTGIWWGNMKEEDQLVDIVVNGTPLLN